MILVTLCVLQQRSLSLSFSYTSSSSRPWLSKASVISRSTTTIASSSNSIMAPSTTTTTNQARGKVFFIGSVMVIYLHDNVPLKHSYQLAVDSKKKGNLNVILLPILDFDDSMIFSNDIRMPSGELKCGTKRMKLIRECVQDLQKNLIDKCQISLFITQGEPFKVFTSLILTKQQKSNIDYDYSVVCQEVAKEEKDACKNVLNAMKTLVGSSRCKLQSNTKDLQATGFLSNRVRHHLYQGI